MDTIFSTDSQTSALLLADSPGRSSSSAVSGAAIVAGTVVAASITLVLVALGAGFGFAALSPWPHAGASAGTFAVTTAIGLIIVQWISAALGGYITGRLRSRWTSVHTHEVFFRDTAHGLITWAAATLVVAAATAGMAMSTAGGATRAAAAATSATAAVVPNAAQAYDVDTLLRPNTVPSSTAPSADVRAEATHIVAQGMATGNLPNEDRTYLIQLVSAQTGVSAADARTRVDTLIAKRQQAEQQLRRAADEARKAAEKTSLFTAFAMMIGAFIACVSAALGGRLRDLHS